MAYTGLTIETKVPTATTGSHCIPAYPVYNSDTTFDATYYTARRTTNDKLAGTTIVYTT